jgi:hypothetical protein
MHDLIVIIDNWKFKPDGTVVSGLLSKNIIEFIERTPTIKTAVLASYSCSAELFSDTVWYNNRKFQNSDYDAYVKQDYLSNISMNRQTWEAMLNYKNTSLYQIAMRNISELTGYINNTKIENIYIAGAAWEICVRDRPLGYINIHKNFPNINIKVDTSCVVDVNSNRPNLDTYADWTPLSNTLYQYTPA